jgi:nitrate/nitrite transport system permease protein
MNAITQLAEPLEEETPLDGPPGGPLESSEQRGSAPDPTPRMRDRIKYGLLRVAKTSGIAFLSPAVLLCFWEEPAAQFRELMRVLVVPMFAFVVFLFLWTVVAPKHKTKSGEVPTPAVVWDAAKDIWSVHVHENSKEDAFLASSEERQNQSDALAKDLDVTRRYAVAIAEKVKEAEADHQVWLTSRLVDIDAKIAEQADVDLESRNRRQKEMQRLAQSLGRGAIKGKKKYLELAREDLKAKEKEAQVAQALSRERVEIIDAPYPPLVAVRQLQTQIAEQKQNITSLADQYGRANRSARLEVEIARLKAGQRTLLAASGSDLAAAAQQVIQSEKRIEAIANSSYAKPWTLPMQIVRSVACAFVGFVIGTAIAIPVGVMCGLSPTFMAATMPFIALFKPVSPIVWLPIALIVVSGFLPDPDTHWFTSLLADLPLIGWMRINPAFIASAITVALCSLWATLVNTALGVSSVDENHLNVARVLRLGFMSRLFKIVIPSALPLIFAGLRISLGVGWMVLIAGELLSSSEGIGKFVWDQFNNGATDSFAKMTVVVFVVGVIGLLLDRVMIVFERLVSFDDGTAAI